VAVDKSIGISKNREDFIKNMKSQGYETKWTDTNKNVTFKDQEGHKVRLANLEKTFNNKNFLKEEIENGFSRIKEKELAKRESSGTQGNRGGGDTKGFELSWDKSEVRTPTSGANGNKQQNGESDGVKRDGQKGTDSKTSIERYGKQGDNKETQRGIQSNEKRNEGLERKQLSEVRADLQSGNGGTRKEQRESNRIDKEPTGISILSKVHSETIMERKSKTILRTSDNNDRDNNVINRSILPSNPLDEITKELKGTIEKMEKEEKEPAKKEERKLEKQIQKPQKLNHHKKDEWQR